MEPAERALFRKLRIKVRRRVDALFAGEYHSAFRGYGLLFDGVREYLYGDDVRNIDWNVSARANHLYVKEYIEERELSIVLAVDMSASIDYGTALSKRDLLLEAAALLLYLARVNNDRISVLIFTDRIEKYIPPRKGRGLMYALHDEIARFEPVARRTDISVAVDFLRKVLKKRSVIFMLSDFLDSDYLTGLRLLGRRHDVIPVVLADPAERGAGFLGLAEYVDLETGENILTETVPEGISAPDFRGFDTVRLSTDGPVEKPVLEFLRKRSRARRAASR
ncbi:MAG: DUF58 domain-containing protein [Spirochaetes bacterium]|jgi:uncharacterized protein (DUF58 family)|nr:DUF58 domain-containing protein [Spirochaetota bacterium]